MNEYVADRGLGEMPVSAAVLDLEAALRVGHFCSNA
jgi:hypothetical protein